MAHLRVLGWDVCFLDSVVMFAVGGCGDLQHDLAHSFERGRGRDSHRCKTVMEGGISQVGSGQKAFRQSPQTLHEGMSIH